MTDLYRLLPEEMEKLVIDMGYQRYRADQILMPLYFKFPKNIADIKQLPKTMIAELVEAGYTIGSAKEIHRVTSEDGCLLYTSPSPRDATLSRMPSSA